MYVCLYVYAHFSDDVTSIIEMKRKTINCINIQKINLFIGNKHVFFDPLGVAQLVKQHRVVGQGQQFYHCKTHVWGGTNSFKL